MKLIQNVSELFQDYRRPQNLKEVRQFLGLASYYRRFIPHFAKIASTLHELTKKDVKFIWNDDHQTAFDILCLKLTEALVLAFPQFDKELTLETDTSMKGLGAVLSQHQADGKIHPVAFASRALSRSEKNYAISETLAVVWAISHFNAYLSIMAKRWLFLPTIQRSNRFSRIQTEMGSMLGGGQKCMEVEYLELPFCIDLARKIAMPMRCLGPLLISQQIRE